LHRLLTGFRSQTGHRGYLAEQTLDCLSCWRSWAPRPVWRCPGRWSTRL